MSISLISNRTMAIRVYLAWLMAALFFFYQYILRVLPSIMVVDLRQTFLLTAEEFASLGAFYLYAYSLLQIPLGILVDRWGVRRTLLSSVVLCIFGAVLMSQATAVWVLQVSRILIGAGSATAFMSSVKIAADWLAPGKRGFLIGMTLTLGTIGPLIVARPLVWSIDQMGWRQVVLVVAALGGLMFLLIGLFLRLPNAEKAYQNQMQPLSAEALVQDILSILRHKRIMIYAFLAVGVYTPLAVLADLWGVAFLMQKFGLSRIDAAQTSTMMYLGLAVGSLVLPWASEKWGFLDISIKICSFLVLINFCLILFGPFLSIVPLSLSLISLGLVCGSEMICFTGAVRQAVNHNSGLIIGVVNTLNMLGGAILNHLIGFLVDLQWKGTYDAHGARLYHAEELSAAFSVLLWVILACCLVALKLKKDPLPLC